MKRRTIPFMVRTLLISMLAGAALGQTPTGEITGLVTDATGAIIQGARIVATHAGTASTRETLSNDRGNYTIPLLPPGSYRVTVESTGFKQLTRTGIEL